MDNKTALHVCYWFGTEIENDLSRQVACTIRTGPDIIEFNTGSILPLSRDARRELRRRIEAAGMTATLNGGVVTPRNDISSPDPACRAEGFAHARRVLEACQDMGTPYWSGLMHSAWLLRPDPADPIADKQRTWERSVAAMRELSPMAADAGVDCCIEIVNRYEHFLLNTAAEGVAFCEAVGHPACRLLLDVFHMSIEEDNVADGLRLAQAHGRLGCLHVGETNRRLPRGGRSNINWSELRAAILESGYDAPVILEPLPFATSGGAGKTCIWRSLDNPADIEGLVEAGRDGIAFIRGICRPSEA